MLDDTNGLVVERPQSALLLLNDSKRISGAADRRGGGHQRRYAPKTRTGCVTCKIRRVKCDEEKPSCRRCASTGRKCDGYTSPSDSSSPSPEPLTVALVAHASTDAIERRTFEFFRARTAPCISGYYQDSVWDRIVLQLSHSEPAVRHAVNALGALHEEKYLRAITGNEEIDLPLVRTGFPMQQYGKALQEMQQLMQSGSVTLDVVLLCALLCIHFEALRESFVPALMHAENAIQLLQSSTKFDPRKVNPSLVRALMRVDLQGCLYLMMRIPGLPYYTASTDSILPNSFHDLTHARDLVNAWTSRVFHFQRTIAHEYKFWNPGDVPLELYARAQELEESTIKIERLLWDFMHKPSVKLTMREQHGLGMLRTRAKINRILAATALYSEASLLDKFLPDMEEILTICLYVLGTENHERQLFSVSLDDGPLYPLGFLATHCRDSRIRRTALDQMRKTGARDGIWHVETTIKLAELCIEHEEALCTARLPTCADIPEWRRIHSAGFQAWEVREDKRTVKAHIRTRPNGMDGDWEDMHHIIECTAGIEPMQDLQKLFAPTDPQLSIRIRSPKYVSWP